jgi:hypothetical protein
MAKHHRSNNRAKIRDITLAEVRLDDEQRLLAFNDFFLGARVTFMEQPKMQLCGSRMPRPTRPSGGSS